MNSGELSQFTNHWYLSVGDGDAVVRVFPGMSLGETETGELTLDGSNAMLSLSIGSDELLVVFVLNGGELESEDGDFCGRRHLAFDSAAQIRLPNNVLRFDKDTLIDAGADAPLLTRAVWRMAGSEDQAPAAGSIDTAPSNPATEIVVAEPSPPEPSAPELDELQSTSVTEMPPILAKVPGQTPGTQQKRQRAIAATAWAGLVGVLIGLGYVGVRTVVTPEQPAPDARQVAVVDDSRESTVVAAGEETLPEEGYLEDAYLEEVPVLALQDREEFVDESASTPPPVASPVATSTPATTSAPVTIPAPLATPEATVLETAVVIDSSPNEFVADDLTSTPAVVERVTPSNTATTPQDTESQRANQNRESQRALARANKARAEERATLAAAAAEAELRREQEQAQTALVVYERDLLAAKLALAQGRLTQPPENSAFALYKQLVASNPESAEARSGFQALGTALVNRAFAEVAAKRWTAARATLAAAAEAGASPDLVADLSGEVAYQQRLADAEAGRFAALYPAAELVALSRTTPRLRRYAPDGIDMVQIEFTISVTGSVQDIEVLGAPPQRLERVVRQAVTDWRFEPVLSGTRPIPVRTRMGLEIP